MPSTKLSTKGQVVIPKPIRDRLGWRSGATLEVEDRDECVVIRLQRGLQDTEVDDLLGCVDYQGPRVTLQEMDEAIAAGASEAR